MPKISVIIPVLNRAAMLETAIQSVLQQNYLNTELIILDGGSIDATVEVIQKYAAYIAYWHSKPDGNPAIAFNQGVEKATGDLIAFLMSDDWFEAGLFSKIAAAHLECPENDMFVCGGRIVVYDEKKAVFNNLHIFNTQKKQTLNLIQACFNPTLAICCYFIKPAVFKKIGLFQSFISNGQFLLANDREWLIRAALANYKTIFVPYLGHTYRSHPYSFSFSNNKETFIRHCYEHRWIAEQHLQNSTLTFKSRFILRYWYQEQTVRLFFLYLRQGKIKKASQVMLNAIKHSPLSWSLILGVTFVKMVGRKIIKSNPNLFRGKKRSLQ